LFSSFTKINLISPIKVPDIFVLTVYFNIINLVLRVFFLIPKKDRIISRVMLLYMHSFSLNSATPATQPPFVI
jgi:hypothetical protein